LQILFDDYRWYCGSVVGTFVLPNPTILQIFSEGIVLAAKKARDLFAQKETWRMNSTFSRVMLVLSIMSVFVLQTYAHHGAQFLSQAREMNTAEVQLGEMAAGKAHDSRVKDFAQMIVKDHKQTLDKIQELWDARSRKAGNKTNQNVQVNAEHKRVSDRLSKLSGEQFDREFMGVMVREHQAAIKAFQLHSHAHGYGTTNKSSSKVDYMKDTDTAQFATETLPTLREHLQKAQDIVKGMRGTTTTQ